MTFSEVTLWERWIKIFDIDFDFTLPTIVARPRAVALGTVVPDISLITFFCVIVNKRRPTKLVTGYLKAESAVSPIRELKSINENITESRSGTDLGIVIG